MTTHATRRAGAQHQITDCQELLRRLPITLAGLAKSAKTAEERTALRTMEARALAVRDAMLVIGRVPRLPERPPQEGTQDESFNRVG